ncbi:MAG: hypothetical protein NC911_01970 [Candidatus Omnitrophica bacterium]|nr:hypothetical protein [Candidatus Omnitrophota bacterium]
MRKVTGYLFPEETVVAVAPGEIRRVTAEQLESILLQTRPAYLYLILARPLVSVRLVKFPFSRPAAIRLALPVELEDLLPLAPGEYLHQWFFVSRTKAESEVLVISVERKLLQPWLDLKRKLGFKLLVCADFLLLHFHTRSLLPQLDCWVTMATDGYFLTNLVQAGRLVNSFSFCGREASAINDFLSSLRQERNLPCYWIGKMDKEVAGKENCWPMESELYQQVGGYWLMELPGIYRGRVPWLRLTALAPFSARLEPKDFLAGMIFLLCLLAMTIPHFQIPELSKQVETMNETMKGLFVQNCPEVKRIIDPVVQMREKIREIGQPGGQLSVRRSVLEVLTAFVRAVPDSLVPSLEISHFILSGRSSLFISGRLDSLAQLEALQVSLSRSVDFASTTVGDISFGQDKKVSFNLSVKLP